MAKFKISVELQGFKLNVEGEREDLPAIQHGIQQQLGAMLIPASAILDGDEKKEKVVVASEIPPKKSKRRASVSSGSGGDTAAVELKTDLEKYGHPRQAWSPVQKSIWLLFVALEQGIAQLSGPVIVATFNKYFKEAGLINTSHVNRDLGRAKAKAPAQVNTDVSKTPPEWFLTTEGKKIAATLVAEATGVSKQAE